MSKIKIQIVEDEFILAKNVKNMLHSLGYVVSDIVSSGEGAIEKASETKPDLVLMDIRLKGDMDGIEAAEQIWKRFNIPVVYLTAYADDKTLQRAKTTGPYGFIQKPFEARDLHIGIEMALYKHKMEQSLRESEKRFRQLAENIPEVFWITSIERDQIIYVSPAYETVWGRTCESLYEQPKSWKDSIYPEDHENITNALEKYILDGGNFDVEYRIVRPDGSIRWIQDRAFSVKSQSGEIDHIVGIAEDITFRKTTEIAQRKLSIAVEQSPASIIITDSNGKIEYVNTKFTKITGYSLDEIVGRDPRILKSGKTPPEVYKRLWDTITSGGEWQGELCNQKKDGELFWEHAVISPIKDSKGNISNYIAVKEDVTEQKRKDKLFLMQTRQAQMGEMLSMIAHQWKQPLTSIGIIAGKIKNRLILNKADKEGIIKSLEKMEKNVQFLSQTINDFRNFFKPNKDKELVKIKDLVQKSLDIIGRSMELNKIEFETSYKSIKSIETYPGELIQVFLNILKNVEDIVKNKRIENAIVTIEEYEKDGFIVIDITDNAEGIPEDIIDDLFLPYFSTKEEKQGTGLGLYMCKTIIEEHCNGNITARNVNGGARFTIKLPIK